MTRAGSNATSEAGVGIAKGSTESGGFDHGGQQVVASDPELVHQLTCRGIEFFRSERALKQFLLGLSQAMHDRMA